MYFDTLLDEFGMQSMGYKWLYILHHRGSQMVAGTFAKPLININRNLIVARMYKNSRNTKCNYLNYKYGYRGYWYKLTKYSICIVYRTIIIANKCLQQVQMGILLFI